MFKVQFGSIEFFTMVHHSKRQFTHIRNKNTYNLKKKASESKHTISLIRVLRDPIMLMSLIVLFMFIPCLPQVSCLSFDIPNDIMVSSDYLRAGIDLNPGLRRSLKGNSMNHAPPNQQVSTIIESSDQKQQQIPAASRNFEAAFQGKLNYDDN